MSCWPPKDPDEVIDYFVDWALAEDPRLESGETIVTSTFSVVSGSVVIDSSSESDGMTTVWLSGGVDGESCQILNRIVTSEGRTYDHTMSLRIKSK